MLCTYEIALHAPKKEEGNKHIYGTSYHVTHPRSEKSTKGKSGMSVLWWYCHRTECYCWGVGWLGFFYSWGLSMRLRWLNIPFSQREKGAFSKLLKV